MKRVPVVVVLVGVLFLGGCDPGSRVVTTLTVPPTRSGELLLRSSTQEAAIEAILFTIDSVLTQSGLEREHDAPDVTTDFGRRIRVYSGRAAVIRKPLLPFLPEQTGHRPISCYVYLQAPEGSVVTVEISEFPAWRPSQVALRIHQDLETALADLLGPNNTHTQIDAVFH